MSIVAGNWKMSLSNSEALALAERIGERARQRPHSQLWIAPSFTALAAIGRLLTGSTVRVGAQNVHWEDSGAFTGEISLTMLKECHCSFAIVGHSERRHGLGETNELVVKRAVSALQRKFSIIACVGETLAERERGETLKVLSAQLNPLLQSLPGGTEALLTIAYEPVWAIGTGKVATETEIVEAHQEIEKIWLSHHKAPCPPILYGGSVTPQNFASISALPRVAGALVGGASVDFTKLSALIEIADKA